MSFGNDAQSSSAADEPNPRWLFTRVDLVVAALCVISIVGFVGSRDIDGVRERRLAGTTADMVRNGRWLLPTLRDEPRFRKPLLANWLAGASMKLFGWSEFAFRLPTALCGLGVVALGYTLGRRLLGPAGGQTTALVMATNPVFVEECHSASTDMPLTFFVSAALVSWHAWQRNARPWSLVWWCMYVSLAAALLAKGPIALAIFAIPFMLELWTSGRWSLLRAMRLGRGLLVALAPLAAWAVAVCLQLEGDAVQRWWGDMQTSFDNKSRSSFLSFFSHFALWPMFGFPWSVPGILALGVPLVRRWLPAWPAIRFAYFWLTGVLAFFCMWAMQPMHYLMPVTLPLAVVIAAIVVRTIELLATRSAGPHLVYAGWLVCASFLGFAVITAGLAHRLAYASLETAAVVGTLLALPAVFATWRMRSSPGQSLAWLVVSGFACVVVLSAWINPVISRARSCATFAKQVDATVQPAEPVHFINMQEALAFYSDRDFRKVPLADDADAEQTVEMLRPGFLLTRRGRYEELAKLIGRRFEAELLVADTSEHRRGNRSDILLLHLRPHEIRSARHRTKESNSDRPH